jgi:hypothetical protein
MKSGQASDNEVNGAEDVNRQADVQKLGEMIKDIRIAMLTTMDENDVFKKITL